MANRTHPQTRSVHGTNPQFLLGKILRLAINDSRYWQESCFGLTAETLIDKAIKLRYVAGTYGRRPSPFICLLLKLLQIQPDITIVGLYLAAENFKYLRALAAFYL